MRILLDTHIALCEKTGFIRLPIEADHIFLLKTLVRSEKAPKHNDPFDRILLAQAKYEDLKLLTHDSQFLHYEENCVINV